MSVSHLHLIVVARDPTAYGGCGFDVNAVEEEQGGIGSVRECCLAEY